LASVLLLLKILLQPLIAFSHLLQAKLVAILLLLQDKQMFFLPVRWGLRPAKPHENHSE
jgi:hypothetical protein